MKTNAISALSAAALLLAGVGTGSGASGRKGAGGGGRTSVIRMRRVNVSRPQAVRAPAHIVNAQQRVAPPARDEKGAAISQRAAATAPGHHMAVARNPAFVRGIESQQRGEMTPNHYYWHNEGGIRYSHYFDGRAHWYGFYHGPTFYWTQYHGGHWWWYDGGFRRWVFWGGGFWWWPGPAGVPYAYIDNNYYPYDEGGVTVASPEYQEPPKTIPAPSAGSSSPSPDGKRAVQITGSDGQAFLYEKNGSGSKYMKFLAKDVSKVKYSGGTATAPLVILLEFKDGSFALFDADGKPQDTTPASGTGSAAPSPPADEPASVPPTPTSAPGQ